MTTSAAANLPVAEICLYGTSQTGAGFYALADTGQRFGTGTPIAHRSFTEAVWDACDELRAAGVTSGKVRIFAPGGERFAVVEIGEHVPNYGSLSFEAVE